MRKYISVIALVFFLSCSSKLFKTKWAEVQAPEEFKARFETTKGNFDILAKRSWSPEGVDRLYTLIHTGFYTDVAIFRVVPNFVAQFGIHNDPDLNTNWTKIPVEDEPVILKNDSMVVSFARGGKRTRTNQIFINLKNNNRLDTLSYEGVTGFPGVAKVTSGMANVLNFYDKYGDKLGFQQDSIQKFGNKFLDKNYPEVDYIIKAYILK